MKPSLPARWFDLCLVPQHDLGAGPHGSHILPTRGALNKLPEETPVKLARGLLMIGGPSAHHDWSPAPLLDAIAAVVKASPEFDWTLGDSRRTPAGFLEQVQSLGLPIRISSYGTTASDWLPRMLMEAREAWITADSTSMICEAFTARARTGILPLPAKSADSRVVRAVEAFQSDGLATPFSEWRENGWRQPLHEASPLHEAARCADEILARFFA
jgi:mitochondrial fission protein ELM1